MDLLSASSAMMLAFIPRPSIQPFDAGFGREMSSRGVQVKSSGVEARVTQGGSTALDQQDEAGVPIVNKDTNGRK